MALTSRISLLEHLSQTTTSGEEPEDLLFSASLGVVFPDDVAIHHGDEKNRELMYTSPHLSMQLTVSDPDGEDRQLFSHYVWNSGLQLVELVEASTLGTPLERPCSVGPLRGGEEQGTFDVRGQRVLELGSGTGLPSLVAVALGATRVVATDHPAEVVIKNLEVNLARCVKMLERERQVKSLSDSATPSSAPPPQGQGQDLESGPQDGDSAVPSRSRDEPGKPGSTVDAVVKPHKWGDLGTPFAASEQGSFDRVVACDCLWMPDQHGNLRRSIAHFLAPGPKSRAWVVGGFHTGRAITSAFFDAEELAAVELEVETIWERDCAGKEREWKADRRGVEDVAEKKRWLVIAVLRRSSG